jgi:hypothetical protein
MLYLLIPLTLLIWGLIGIRIAGHLNKPVNPSNVNLKSYNDKPEASVRDMKIIAANYSDPFLDRPLLSQKSNFNDVSLSRNKTNNNLKKDNLQWPSIRYGGRIVNKKSKSALYLIQVDGKNQIIKNGEVFNNLKLIKVFPDSIIVKLKNHTKTIAKEKL